MYARRFAEAHRARAVAEARMRYSLYIDSMPVDDLPQLTTEVINRMLGYALNSKKLKGRLMDTSQLINEINLEHMRAMNKIIFDTTVARGESGCPAALVRGVRWQQWSVESQNSALVTESEGCESQ